MIEKLDLELKRRADKSIANMRLIASRVKRQSLEEAMQRCGIVVTSLDRFRKFALLSSINMVDAKVYQPFYHNQEILVTTLDALQQADAIYKMLTKAKQTSYKEEIKQVKLLFVDVTEYLETMLKENIDNAEIKE